MKKILVATAMVAAMGIIGLQQASADWGMGGYHGMGGWGPKGGPCYEQLDAAAKTKVDKFYDETKDLRKQMVMKHAEERAVMQADNPDPVKAAKLAGELFDLRASMQAKADAAGVPSLMGCGGCAGAGRGMGPRHGGRMLNGGLDVDDEPSDKPGRDSVQ